MLFLYAVISGEKALKKHKINNVKCLLVMIMYDEDEDDDYDHDSIIDSEDIILSHG